MKIKMMKRPCEEVFGHHFHEPLLGLMKLVDSYRIIWLFEPNNASLGLGKSYHQSPDIFRVPKRIDPSKQDIINDSKSTISQVRAFIFLETRHGEMMQFDKHIFQMGWKKKQQPDKPDLSPCYVTDVIGLSHRLTNTFFHFGWWIMTIETHQPGVLLCTVVGLSKMFCEDFCGVFSSWKWRFTQEMIQTPEALNYHRWNWNVRK